VLLSAQVCPQYPTNFSFQVKTAMAKITQNSIPST
jgi:hypothetical protein